MVFIIFHYYNQILKEIVHTMLGIQNPDEL